MSVSVVNVNVSVCVSVGEDSVYGGKLVLLVGVCEQRMLLAGHQSSHSTKSIVTYLTKNEKKTLKKI